MQIPIQISFHGVPRSPEIESIIMDRAAGLEKYHGRLTGCHVIVTSDRTRAGDGRLYSVRVDLVVPGGEVIAARRHRMHPHVHQLEAAIDQAFHVARRRLEDFVRRIRGSVKQHEQRPIARVSTLLPDGGFIRTPDGREIYFHRNALRGKQPGRIAVGDTVRYSEEQGDKGPNASMVRLVAHAPPRSRLKPVSKTVRARKRSPAKRR
jgi:cold shock CspA family protein